MFCVQLYTLSSHICNIFFIRRQFYQTLLKLPGAFYQCHGRGKYKLHSLFIVSRLSTYIQPISGFSVVMGKPIKKRHLATVKHDWTSIIYWWANRKRFLSARCKIWNSKVVFCNKTNCLLRHGRFNRELWVATPVEYFIQLGRPKTI